MTIRDKLSKLKEAIIESFSKASVQGIGAPLVLMPVPGIAAIQSASALQAAEEKTPSVVDVIRNGRIERTIKPDDQEIISESYIPPEFLKELQSRSSPKNTNTEITPEMALRR